MKSVKELLTETTIEENYPVSPNKGITTKSPNVPSVIVLRRKAIRQFPDQKLALYYSDALDKYVTVPFGKDGEATGISLSEEEQINEFLPAIPAITGAAALAGRVAALAAPYALRAGKKLLRAADKAIRGTKKAGSAASKGAKKVRRKVGNKASAATSAALGAVGSALTGGGDNNNNTNNQNSGENLRYKDTQFKVNPNVSVTGGGPQMRRNWDEIEKARTKRIWNSGSYTPSSSSGQVYEQIQNIVSTNKPSIVNIGESTLEITPRIARKICECYNMLNKKNQENFEVMLNESVASFKKIIDFSIRKGK